MHYTCAIGVVLKLLIYCLECLFNPARASWIKCSNLQPEPKRSSGCRTSFTRQTEQNKMDFFFLLFSKCHSQRGEDWVGHRCFTVWVYLRNQFKKEKKRKKMGEPWGKCVFDYTDKPFLHFMLFFHLVRGDSVGLWTLTLLEIHELFSQLLFFKSFSHGSERAREFVYLCIHLDYREP